MIVVPDMHIILKPQNERDAILAAARAALQQQQELALAAGGARLWSTLLNLSQPIFQGRSLLHNKRAAEAAYRQVLANHKAVTLQAFADVADALWALEQDTQTYDAFVEAERISQQSLDLAQLQYKVGTGDYTDVLTAQQTYQQARISRATAEADRYLDAVLLFQALGGGWWNRPETLAGQVQLLAASTAGNTP